MVLSKKYDNSGTYLKLAQSIIHTNYIMYVFNLFLMLANVIWLHLLYVLRKLKINYLNIYNFILNLSKNEMIYMRFFIYNNKEKIIPSGDILEKLLTPVNLAHWREINR
jgi:hypothetical protein